MAMKFHFLSILLCCFLLITTASYGTTYMYQGNQDTTVTAEQDTSSRDSSNILNIDGREIRIGEKEAIRVYKTSSKEITLYLFLSLGVVVALVFLVRYSKTKIRQREAALSTLSERELMVAKLIQEGKQNKEIAEALFISISTVKTHINNIYKKLDIRDRKSLKKFRFPAS